MNIVTQKLLLLNVNHWEVKKLTDRQGELRKLIAEKQVDYATGRKRNVPDRRNMIVTIQAALAADVYQCDYDELQRIANVLETLSLNGTHGLLEDVIEEDNENDDHGEPGRFISAQNFHNRYYDVVNGVFFGAVQTWQYQWIPHAQQLYSMLLSLYTPMVDLVNHYGAHWENKRKSIIAYKLSLIGKLNTLIDMLLKFGAENFGSLPRVLYLQEQCLKRTMAREPTAERYSVENAVTYFNLSCSSMAQIIQTLIVPVRPKELIVDILDGLVRLQSWLETVTPLVASHETDHIDLTFRGIHNELRQLTLSQRINTAINHVKTNTAQFADTFREIETFDSFELALYDSSLFMFPQMRDFSDPLNFSRLLAEQIRAMRWNDDDRDISVEYKQKSVQCTCEGWRLQRFFDRHPIDDSFCKWSMWLNRNSLDIYEVHATAAILYFEKESLTNGCMLRFIEAVIRRKELVQRVIQGRVQVAVAPVTAQTPKLDIVEDYSLDYPRIVETFYLQPVTEFYLFHRNDNRVAKQGIIVRWLTIIERLKSKLWLNDQYLPFRELALHLFETVETTAPYILMILSIFCEALIQWTESNGVMNLGNVMKYWLQGLEPSVEAVAIAPVPLKHLKVIELNNFKIQLYSLAHLCHGFNNITQELESMIIEIQMASFVWLSGFTPNRIGNQHVIKQVDMDPYSSLSEMARCLQFWILKYLELVQMEFEEEAAMERFIQKHQLAIELPGMLNDIVNLFVRPLKAWIEERFIQVHITSVCQVFQQANVSLASNRVHAIAISNENIAWIDAVQNPTFSDQAEIMMEELAVQYRDLWINLVERAIDGAMDEVADEQD